MININNFDTRLSATAPINNHAPHSWICEVTQEGFTKLEKLTDQEIEIFYHERRAYSSLRKLSFSEIIQKVQNIFKIGETPVKEGAVGDKEINLRFDISSEISICFNLKNAFDTQAAKVFETKYQELQNKVIILSNIICSLQKMSERAKYKRVEKLKQKFEGLLGKIKLVWAKINYFIWQTFYDKSAQINELQKEIPTAKELLETCCTTLQDRILINMEGFAEEIKLQDVRYDFEEFATPSDIKKKWLTRYAADKMPDVSEKAKEYRNRILILLGIWDTFIKKGSKEG